MDLIVPIALVIIFFIFFSICGWCCKRHRQGTVYGPGGVPVTITSQPVNASPVVIPPYPMDPRHPTPQISNQHPPAPGFVPTNPYPPNTGVYQGAPYPSTTPYPPTTPYPMGSAAPGQTAPPPSYHEAIGQPMPPQAPPTNEMYAKQAPYNPHY